MTDISSLFQAVRDFARNWFPCRRRGRYLVLLVKLWRIRKHPGGLAVCLTPGKEPRLSLWGIFQLAKAYAENGG